MSKLPVANFKTMDTVLRHLGFVAVRQRGSHVFYRHTDGRTTTLPNHGKWRPPVCHAGSVEDLRPAEKVRYICEGWLETYNPIRPHEALQDLAPRQFAQ